ncbi:DUF63 family protein [Halocatena halophila]|uniref:DUF63 family protein n=1 Tax=Halocatena halophila TaxID=2814576 RepID=UPI002ED17D76
MEPLLLPAGFELPPPEYLLVVVGAGLCVLWGLFKRSPAITQPLVVALTPWMATGATLYALSQVQWLPAAVRPFTTAPIVYLTVFAVVGGLLVLVGDRDPKAYSIRSTPGVIGLTGLFVLGCVGVLAVQAALAHPPVTIVWPAMAVAGTILASAAVWATIWQVAPDIVRVTGGPGLLVVVGHLLDGVSTAVGMTQLGFGEQTPLSRLLIDLGGVWLFVGVKLLLAVFVIWVLAEYVRESPSEGNLLLAVVAAVGLGPGIHNIVLFSIAP